MRFVWIINPAAGKGTRQEALKEQLKLLDRVADLDFCVLETEAPGQAGELARREARRGDEVCIFACGGEGTCFEVVNGVIGYENVSVGVFPCGSANDFLKFFGQKDAFLDVNRQLRGHKARIDLVKAGEYYCVNGCSVGMDAMVARDMRIFKRWPLVTGSMAYQLAIVKNFLSRLGVRMTITVDGESLGERRALFAVAANAPVYGGGYRGAPDADPFDGKLDFTLVSVISRLRVPKFLSHYKNGTHGSLDYCMLRRCSKVRITADSRLPVNLDGEIVYADDITFELVPGALSFWLPDAVKKPDFMNKI